MVDKARKASGAERRAKKVGKRTKKSVKAAEKQNQKDIPEITESLENVSLRNSKKKKAAKTSATTNRISKEQKAAVTESGRGLYVAFQRSIVRKKSAAQTALKPFLSSLQLRGLVGVVPSGVRYYALMFENEDRRDRAATKIAKAIFKFDGSAHKLVVHNFGENPGKREVIFQISANLLATGQDIADAIVDLYRKIEPQFVGPFVVRQIFDNDMPTCKWAVKFEGMGPEKFQKQMPMGNIKVLLTQEPNGMCRFCGTSGHTIFECTTKGEKELGTEVFRGIAGPNPKGEDFNMED